jgi:hypothetical protein
VGALGVFLTTTMFSSFFVAVLASIHSFTFVVATAEQPMITPAPSVVKRQVAGAPGTPILSTLTYAFTDLPYQVYPFAVLRGPQFGFNKCNSTTEGDNSNCQTLIANNAVRLFSFLNSVRLVLTILPNRATFAYGAHLQQRARLATWKPRL